MQFKISRATYSKRNEPPCVEAVLVRNGPHYYDKEYEITLNTLEELIAFIERQGPLIIDKDSITIYDDYVE